MSAVLSAPSDLPRPNGLIAHKGLELLTFRTPNGMTAISLSAFSVALTGVVRAQSVDSP